MNHFEVLFDIIKTARHKVDLIVHFLVGVGQALEYLRLLGVLVGRLLGEAQDELDFLFDKAMENPIIVKEVEASPYTFSTMMLESFIALPGVPEDLKERMRQLIHADMGAVAAMAGKVQKAS